MQWAKAHLKVGVQLLQVDVRAVVAVLDAEEHLKNTATRLRASFRAFTKADMKVASRSTPVLLFTPPKSKTSWSPPSALRRAATQAASSTESDNLEPSAWHSMASKSYQSRSVTSSLIVLVV